MMAASEHDDFILALSKICRVRGGVLGSTLTTFTIGGPLSALVEPENQEQLERVLHHLKLDGRPYRILGAGSNLLISDDGVADVVIRLGKGFRYSRELARNGNLVELEIGGASSLMTVSRSVSEEGLSGLEFAGGIPASVGGAVFMNAGAHGGEMASCLKEVLLVRDGKLERLAASAFPFQYRSSGIESNAVVVGAVVSLVPGDRDQISRRRAEFLQERKVRQPLTAPCAGSVFKNPSTDNPAGKVLESCGLKGAHEGGAIVSTLHANWIINPERTATAHNVRTLMHRCIDTVAAKTGIRLHPELVKW